MAETALKKALPATVLIEVEGRSYSGAIVGKDALVLTVGHAVAGSPPDVTLLLSDGRRAKGRVLGIDRAADTAMVKIVDEGDYPFVEIAPKAADLQGRDFLVTVAHPPDFQPGRPPSVGLVQVRGEMNGRIWADSSRPIIGSGGPLLIAGGGAADEGTLVGIQSGYAWGGFLYTPAADYQKSWNRLKQGGAWGQWGPGTGPLLGIYSAEDENGCKISQVVPGGPADKAGLRSGDVVKAIDGQNLKDSQALAPVLSGKDPGQEVNLQVQRGGNAMQVKLTLGRRK